MNYEIEYLRKNNPESADNIEAINALKGLRELVEQEFDVPEPYKSILENWNRLKILAYMSALQEPIPSLKACIEGLQAKFVNFHDEYFMESYMFADFPCIQEQSFAARAKDYCNSEKAFSSVISFGKAISKTRLGLYEVILANSKQIRIKESFTNKTLEVVNTIEIANPGEMLVARILPLNECNMIFGNPIVFPKERKKVLVGMVESKAYQYYSSFSQNEKVIDYYEKHMKLSGPYWMSIYSDDPSVDIVDPDYWERFLK